MVNASEGAIGLRGLVALEVLAGMAQPAPLRAVAARIGLSESQTFRLLRALESAGYVDHLGRSGYRIGSRAVALGTLVGPRPSFLRAVQPAIGRLAFRSREAVAVHLRTGRHRVLVLGLPAPAGPLREPGGVVGERSPLGAGASGRVILAHLPEDEWDGLAPHERSRLREVRERGYETSLAENHPGIAGISGPLLTSEGVALGSVTIAGPIERLTQDRLLQLARALRSTCRELSPLVASLLGPDPGATVSALDL